MADILKGIRLFNKTLPLVTPSLAGLSVGDRRRILAKLSELVRKSAKDGLEDPQAIASKTIEAAARVSTGKPE